MKGLLIKDFNVTVHTWWPYLLILVPFFVASAIFDDSFFTAFLLVFTSILPINSVTVDEKNRWQNYANCLPYSRKEIVASKYILGAVITAGTIVISLAIQGTKIIIKYGLSVSIVSRIAALTTIFLIISSILPNIVLPFLFKFGVEKAKVAYTILLFFAGGFARATTGILGHINLTESLTKISDLPIYLLIGIGLLFVLLCQGASFAISVHAYEKRDF